MKILNVKQGSQEWLDARAGIPTSSAFDRIITKSGKPSASADRYLARLVAEWYLGTSLDEEQTQFMERGSELEASAVRYYEFTRDLSARPVGLVLRDDERAGASPDRLVGEDGVLEIKCPSAEVHMCYVLGGLADQFKVQQQGQLWVCEREWSDLLSYNPVLPRATVRSYRDEAFITALAAAVDEFCDRLDAAKEMVAPQKRERDAHLRELNSRFA